jgi:hypothetical protein
MLVENMNIIPWCFVPSGTKYIPRGSVTHIPSLTGRVFAGGIRASTNIPSLRDAIYIMYGQGMTCPYINSVATNISLRYFLQEKSYFLQETNHFLQETNHFL